VAAGVALQPVGHGNLRWLGLPIYDARLWVAPDFSRAQFAQHAFALELHYQRGFTAADIARRSLAEMRRAAPVDEADARRWQAQLQALLPDVRPGDRIVGVNRPRQGVAFLVNGRPQGGIDEPGFAARFFGIWLAPATSEPALRDALLAGTAP
jgi:hypothetical protein